MVARGNEDRTVAFAGQRGYMGWILRPPVAPFRSQPACGQTNVVETMDNDFPEARLLYADALPGLTPIR